MNGSEFDIDETVRECPDDNEEFDEIFANNGSYNNNVSVDSGAFISDHGFADISDGMYSEKVEEDSLGDSDISISEISSFVAKESKRSARKQKKKVKLPSSRHPAEEEKTGRRKVEFEEEEGGSASSAAQLKVLTRLNTRANSSTDRSSKNKVTARLLREKRFQSPSGHDDDYNAFPDLSSYSPSSVNSGKSAADLYVSEVSQPYEVEDELTDIEWSDRYGGRTRGENNEAVRGSGNSFGFGRSAVGGRVNKEVVSPYRRSPHRTPPGTRTVSPGGSSVFVVDAQRRRRYVSSQFGQQRPPKGTVSATSGSNDSDAATAAPPRKSSLPSSDHVRRKTPLDPTPERLWGNPTCKEELMKGEVSTSKIVELMRSKNIDPAKVQFSKQAMISAIAKSDQFRLAGLIEKRHAFTAQASPPSHSSSNNIGTPVMVATTPVPLAHSHSGGMTVSPSGRSVDLNVGAGEGSALVESRSVCSEPVVITFAHSTQRSLSTQRVCFAAAPKVFSGASAHNHENKILAAHGVAPSSLIAEREGASPNGRLFTAADTSNGETAYIHNSAPTISHFHPGTRKFASVTEGGATSSSTGPWEGRSVATASVRRHHHAPFSVKPSLSSPPTQTQIRGSDSSGYPMLQHKPSPSRAYQSPAPTTRLTVRAVSQQSSPPTATTPYVVGTRTAPAANFRSPVSSGITVRSTSLGKGRGGGSHAGTGNSNTRKPLIFSPVSSR